MTVQDSFGSRAWDLRISPRIKKISDSSDNRFAEYFFRRIPPLMDSRCYTLLLEKKITITYNRSRTIRSLKKTMKQESGEHIIPSKNSENSQTGIRRIGNYH